MKESTRCLYNADFSSFVETSNDAILGHLSKHYHGNVLTATNEAWESEIGIMKAVISRLPVADGQIVFEYDIPRLGKRIDVTLLMRGLIFCLEFKVGEHLILESDIDQVLDYALDLQYFHMYSQGKVIVPVLIATKYSRSSAEIKMSGYDDRVVNPLVTGESGLAGLILRVLEKFPDEAPVNANWLISPYSPTPHNN